MLGWSTGLAPNPLIPSISALAKDDSTGGYAVASRTATRLTLHSLLVNAQLDVLRADTREPVEPGPSATPPCSRPSHGARAHASRVPR